MRRCGVRTTQPVLFGVHLRVRHIRANVLLGAFEVVAAVWANPDIPSLYEVYEVEGRFDAVILMFSRC